MLDHLPKTRRVPNKAVMAAEEVYQRFLTKGIRAASAARKAFVIGGRKKLREFARNLFNDKK